MPAVDLAASPGLALALLGVAGVFAGIVNALAGGGNFLILPLLVALGLPSTVANGTSRVGVVLQGIASTWAFEREAIGEWRITLRLALPMTAAALAGAALATRLDEALFRPLIGVILLVWAVALAFRPGRFLRAPPAPQPPSWRSDLASVAIGVYGGFLQAGVGFPLLALLVPGLGYPPVIANAIKVRVVLIYSALALPVFASAGHVAWREGLVLAAGTALGGWLGARWQIRAGAGLVRWATLVMVAVGGVMMLR